MSECAFKATYSDWKLVKTRGVVQVIFEVPITDESVAYQVLGGMPDVAHERWFGIAPLNMEDTKSRSHPRTETAPVLADPSPVTVTRAHKSIALDKRLTQRAGMLCADRMFQLWLEKLNPGRKIDEEQAAKLVRDHCGVQSRRDIAPGTSAADRFNQMLDAYTAWQACLEDAS